MEGHWTKPIRPSHSKRLPEHERLSDAPNLPAMGVLETWGSACAT